MNFEQYKTIEEYFRIGELIRNQSSKIEALKRVNSGIVSLGDIEIIQKELSTFGFHASDFLELDKAIELLKDELRVYEETKKEIIKHAKALEIDLYQILFEKGKYDSDKAITA